MPISPSNASDKLIKVIAWAILVSIHLLETKLITDKIPENHLLLIYPAILSIIGFVLLSRFKNQPVAWDIMEIAAIDITYFVILIACYFLMPDVYSFLYFNVTKPLLWCLFSIGVLRLSWFFRDADGLTLNWPVWGVYRGVRKLYSKKLVLRHRILTYLSLLACIPVGIFLSHQLAGLSDAILGLFGLIVIASFGTQTDAAVVNTIIERNTLAANNIALKALLTETSKVVDQLRARLILQASTQIIVDRNVATQLFEKTLTDDERTLLTILEAVNPEVRSNLIADIISAASKYSNHGVRAVK